MKPLAAAVAAIAVALAIAGCGTPSPDLFEVKRSGADPVGTNAFGTDVLNGLYDRHADPPCCWGAM